MPSAEPYPLPGRRAAPSIWVEILLNQSLEPIWSDWFGDLALESLPPGQARLSGALRDQAALHGVLERIRDLNLPLVSVQVSEKSLSRCF